MKNKEKFINELAEIALNDDILAVDKNTGIAVECCSIDCSDCLFIGNCNKTAKNVWGESEWKDPITAERLNKEFKQMCKDTSCYKCEYSGIYGCQFAWLLEHYNVIKKEMDE